MRDEILSVYTTGTDWRTTGSWKPEEERHIGEIIEDDMMEDGPMEGQEEPDTIGRAGMNQP